MLDPELELLELDSRNHGYFMAFAVVVAAGVDPP
jgi:hypothetical protein